MSKARREQFFFATFYFEMLGRNFRCLRCARQRAGQDEIRPRFDSGKERADFVHLFFAPLAQRTFVVGLFPVWPIRFAMSEKIKVHISILWLVLEDAPLRATGARVNLPQTRAAKERVPIMSALNSFRK